MLLRRTRYTDCSITTVRTNTKAWLGLRCDAEIPWVSAWTGPQRFHFGNDAMRKLQLYVDDWATGLDTGAMYGNNLTDIILPRP